MKKKQIEEFEALNGQLQSFYTEMNTLVKKNPNDALNGFKLKLLNSTLEKANKILGKTHRPFDDFEKFDDESMPSTSDVLLMVSQYLSAFEQLRVENIFFERVRWIWNVSDSSEQIRTAPPKKLDK